MIRLAYRTLSALALSSALVLAATPSALADPPQPIPVPPPAATDIVGVGAQVTESLFNQLSTDYNASLTAAGNTTSPRLYSWDSVGANLITPKAGSSPLVRPMFSSAGITAVNATTSSTVDFARSTRGPSVNDPASTLFVNLAKDAVSWAAPTGGHAPNSLTAAQLRGIYECHTTNWRQIDSALPDAPIKPALPIYNYEHITDAASMFLAGIQQTSGPSYVRIGDCVTLIREENSGTGAFLHDPDVVVPYSVGRYIGQTYGGHATPTDNPGALVPRAIGGVPVVNPSSHTLHATFAASYFAYRLRVALREAEWNAGDAHARALREIFSPNGWICWSGASRIRSHGFLAFPPGACGSTEHS
ncbi:hypothetical protein ACFVYP_05410 [Kitasatospora sp. NPDC058201]|uniref:hypothetical protein n=1 Tax=unclassified Kitasatospora TaxID=2633591 RepID=UPI003660E7FC